MSCHRPSHAVHAALTLVVLIGVTGGVSAQGLVLPSVGPVNRSMAGASVAAPLDATGALYWNPATLSGLPSSEMDIGVELLYSRSRVSSAVAPNTFGPGIPPVGLAGSTNADNGVFPLPNLGLSYRPADSCWTFGLGVFAIGGFGANYPSDPANPILSPRPPTGLGLGAISSELLIMEIAPMAAYQLTDHLSVGGGPTVCLAKLTLDPGFFAAPDDANGDGFATFPAATHTRIHWGAGFQVGAFYATDAGWNFGASFRSPQWFETFRYNSTDELGRPRPLKLRFDYPLIPSIGISYSGFKRLLVATDFRYIDYHDAKGLGKSGFDPSGAGIGLGWRSVFSMGAGAQYLLGEKIALRMGYSFNTNPIPDAVSAFNIASPPVYQHAIYVGGSYWVTPSFALTAAYLHAFENSITGPILSPLGAVPGTSVTNDTVTDSILAGATVTF